MKRLLIAATAAALTVAGSTAAFAADSATQTFGLTATVPNTCNIPARPTTTATNAAYNDNGPNGGTMNFTTAINTTDATAAAGTVVLTYSNVMCNYAAELDIESTRGAMIYDGGVSVVAGTFADEITYTASAAFCAQTSSITANNLTNANVPARTDGSCTGANIGDLVVTVNTDAITDPLLSGGYTDTLTVKIGANL